MAWRQSISDIEGNGETSAGSSAKKISKWQHQRMTAKISINENRSVIAKISIINVKARRFTRKASPLASNAKRRGGASHRRISSEENKQRTSCINA